VASFLEQRHIPVLDVDKLGHKAIEIEKERLLERFGEGILGSDGLIDRKRLGNMVFGRQKELKALEEIIHPAVNRETLAWINTQPEKACVINAALLHRSSAFEMLDAVIIVEAPFFVRLIRARKRDRLPWTALLKRFKSQRKFNAQFFKKTTDIYRVENSVCFGFKKDFAEKRLNKRVNDILSFIGIRV
jgi:dephospho-CoA kinase